MIYIMFMDRQTEETVPKFTAQKCPVCNGFGTLKYGAKTCQGCFGKGFITINNKTGLPVKEGEKDGEINK